MDEQTETADRFRRVAEVMTQTIARVPEGGWELPSPCAGWNGRDVLRHLVGWLPGPGFLLGAFGVETGPIPSVDEDPAGAWDAVRAAVQRALDDPATAARVEDCGPLGQMSFVAAVEMTCIPDVLIHTWDLAQAAGLTVELDAETVANQAAGLDAMSPDMDAAMRGSGQFGPRVALPPDADPLARVLAFTGRDPAR